MAYVRDRQCRSCGKVETVRKDNLATQCKACASSAAGKVTAALRKAIAHRPACSVCGRPVKSCRAVFCSVKCKSDACRTARQCSQCGTGFTILASSLKTNASGKFCSRPCYEKHMCRTKRTTGRGSQWNKTRREVVRATPFCAICGTTKRLQVHHIIPFRLTGDNSKANLVPLCVKHHKTVEMLFVGTEGFGIGPIEQEMWQGMLRERQFATLMNLRDLKNANI